jgi:hypothetical protein
VIDLNYTRAGLVSEIEAKDSSRSPLKDITDPRVRAAEVHVFLRGHTREDLFPLLKIALSERFAAVPRPVLIRDLLMPLKNALGNAYKHGNGRDSAKTIAVEIVLTPKGALIAVTDEGDGFDASLLIQRMHNKETYFLHYGAGFRSLHQAMSPVTWENGGRTLLLCFRPSISELDAPSRHVTGGRLIYGRVENRGEKSELRRLLDPAWMLRCLSEELPELQNGRAKLESCRSYLGRGLAGDDCGIRYVLRINYSRARRRQLHILTGRLHAGEATAAADFEAAAGLHKVSGWWGLTIPEPVTRLKAEQRLVLYKFDPWMNLWQYLTYRGSRKAFRHTAKRVGRALARLHLTRVALRSAEPAPVASRFRTMVEGAERALKRLSGGAAFVARFCNGVRRIQERSPVGQQRACAPIHGSLGWDCIHHGVDGRFYFYRFETCQMSDAVIDLGGFAADLLSFMLARDDITAYHVCCDALLTSYNSGAEQPLSQDQLPFYIALAIGERLRDMNPPTIAGADQLLVALDAAGRLA